MTRILRIVLGVFAVLAGGFFIYTYFNPSLPKCDSKDADKLLRDLVIKAAASVPAVANATDRDAISKTIKFSNIKEVSYDKDKQVRECTATVDLAVGEQKIADAQDFAYRVTWQDRDNKMFYIELSPLKPK